MKRGLLRFSILTSLGFAFGCPLVRAETPPIPLELLGRLDGDAPRCAQGSPQQVKGIERPIQSVSCNYDVNYLNSMIEGMFDTANSRLDEKYIEEKFRIPSMTTLYDDVRVADYQTMLSGFGGWKMSLEVRDGFWPSNVGPPEFVPGPHPRRLNSTDHGRLDVDFQIYTKQRQVDGKRVCNDDEDFSRDLAQNGWRIDSAPMTPHPHGMPPPSYSGTNGRSVNIIPTFLATFLASSPTLGDNICLTQISFSKRPSGTN